MKPFKKGSPRVSVADPASVEIRTPGFWGSVAGSATTVIAIVAILGLILLALNVVRLAERAIDREQNIPRQPAHP